MRTARKKIEDGEDIVPWRDKNVCAPVTLVNRFTRACVAIID